MFRTLREWFDYKDEPTGETAEWYAKILDCLDRIEAGEANIDSKPAKSALIWCAVNFINALGDGLEDDSQKHYLEKLVNLIFMLIRNMSFLTYRQILDLFPVWIPPCEEEGNRYFDGKDIYFDNELSAFNSPSIDDGFSLLVLCGCGIYFGEETMGTTDFDAEIGDDVMEFVTNNRNPTLREFYLISIYAYNSLWRAIVAFNN